MEILNLVAIFVFAIFTGVFSGTLGIGGAIFLVPFMVYVFNFDQKLAQGTTLLAFTLPSFILGTITYYKSGNVKWEYSIAIFFGILVGAFLGANIVQKIDSKILSRIFGITIIVIGIKMIVDSFK